MLDTAVCDVYEDREWNPLVDTQAEAFSPVVYDEFATGAAGLRQTYRNLASLWVRNPDEDEWVEPSQHALERAYSILERASYGMSDFPTGSASTDDSGGIRIAWWKGRTHCVTLVAGHNQQSPSYIFVKHGAADRGSMSPAFPGVLASCLSRLAKAQ